MNDAKSVPFVHMPTVKKSMYTPQVTKKPTIPTNNVKFANHFPIRTMVNGTLKIYSESCKICPICSPRPKSCEIHAFCANFPRFSVPTSEIVKFHDICILLYFCRFRAFHTCWEATQATVNSAKSAINVLICSLFIL